MNEYDVGTDLVMRDLRRREVTYLRMNTERLSSRFFAWDGTTCQRERDRPIARELRPAAATGLAPFEAASAHERDVLQNQWRAVVRGLSTLGARWMNPLDAGLAAESKMLQIATGTTVRGGQPRAPALSPRRRRVRPAGT